MSIHAVSWAFRQELPPIPKLVLIALCERANSETGECWPGIKIVAEAAGLSERSVVTYIGALVRNGYVDRQSMRGKDGRKRTNHYWILFDRIAAPWIGPGTQVEEIPPLENDEDEAAATTESEPHANPAHGHQAQTDSHGPCATACVPHIMPEPSVIEPSESEQVDRAPVPPTSPPQSFAPNKRKREQERQKAADETRRPASFPVIEGSEPWKAWVARGHPATLTSTIEVSGRKDRGWYFPTLWPPKETGPPGQAPPLSKTG